MTTNASDSWNITFERTKPGYSISTLWNIIKHHNPDYYAKVYPQFERKTFQTSKYNFIDFKRDTIETFPQLMEKLSLCIAINLKNNDIVYKDDDGYNVMPQSRFLSDNNICFTFKMSEEEQEEANKKQ